jgi:hypothetical protein
MPFLWVVAGFAIPLATAAADHAPRWEVQVTAMSLAGGEDAGLGNALAQALIDSGLPATRVHEGSAECERCLQVTVRQVAPERFIVRANSRDAASEATVQIASVASTFDEAHALAIEVESLSEHVRVEEDRAARRSTVTKTERATVLSPTPVATSPVTPSASTAVFAARDSGPPPADAARPLLEPVVLPERLSFDVAATVLLGTSGELFMQGVLVGARTALGSRLDVRASIALLRPQNVHQSGPPYHREVFPMRLLATLAPPKLSAIRAGGGVEGLSVSDDVAGQESPPSWAIGPLVWLEYRHAFHGFALFAGAHAAFHPPAWTLRGDSPRPLPYPSWTLGASVGLGFGIL